MEKHGRRCKQNQPKPKKIRKTAVEAKGGKTDNEGQINWALIWEKATEGRLDDIPSEIRVKFYKALRAIECDHNDETEAGGEEEESERSRSPRD
jgi:hypothetical protein